MGASPSQNFTLGHGGCSTGVAHQLSLPRAALARKTATVVPPRLNLNCTQLHAATCCCCCNATLASHHSIAASRRGHQCDRCACCRAMGTTPSQCGHRQEEPSASAASAKLACPLSCQCVCDNEPSAAQCVSGSGRRLLAAAGHQAVACTRVAPATLVRAHAPLGWMANTAAAAAADTDVRPRPWLRLDCCWPAAAAGATPVAVVAATVAPCCPACVAAAGGCAAWAWPDSAMRMPAAARGWSACVV